MKMMMEITSKENRQGKRIKKLMESKRFRWQEQQFVIEGIRLCTDAFQTGLYPKQVFVTETCKEKENCNRILDAAEEVFLITEEISQRLSDTQTPQGIFCVFSIPEMISEKIQGKTVFLSSLQDPGNVGTIIRTAEAFGVEWVVLSSDCPDLYSSKVLRASMGGIFRLKAAIVPNLEKEICAFRENGGKVFAAALKENSIPITEVLFSGSTSTAIVIGNEGNGLSDQVISCCTAPVVIPMQGRAESLNAAAAASIAIWEMCRPGKG